MPRRRTFMDCWERVRSTGVLGKRSKHADQTDVLTEAMYDALAARIKEQTGQGVDHNEASLSSVRSYLEDTEAELSQIKAKFYPKPETTIPDQTKPAPPAAAAKVETKVAAKEPWEMTREEPWQMTAKEFKEFEAMDREWPTTEPAFGKQQHIINEARRLTKKIIKSGADVLPYYDKHGPNAPHRAIIEAALSEGKPVPAEVLADYPDLKPPPPSAAAKVGTTGAAPSGKFMLKTFEGRADAEIEGESGTLTVRASTAENADGTHSVNTLMVFVPPGILDPRSAPRQEVKLTQPVTGKTKEEARFKAFEAFTETLNAGEFTPAAAAKPETPAAAVAEVKEHLQKVAKDAPSPAAAQRSQKDIKTELVQRLEAAIEKAPSERDLADLGEGKRDPTEGEMVSKRTQQSRMTIEIPGDGTFTVWNTKESLGEVLQRAKRISTATKYKGFTERPIKSLSEAELKEMRVEPPSTPSGLPDEGDGSNVLREYATENLSGQEQSANPSGGNTDNQGKFSKPGSGVTIKPSSLLPENTRSVRTNTARVKAGDLIKLNDGWYEVEGYTPDPVYIDTGILRVRERGNPSKWAELKKDPGENITVQRPTERREQSRATPSDNPPLTPRVIREHLRRKWGLTTDSSVVLVNNPDAPVDAEVIFQDGELVRIEINAPAIASTAQLDEAVEHELSHAASDNLDLESLFSQLPATQQTQIEADMDRLGYQPGELSNERNARQLHALAKAWRGRSWFTKLTGEILRLAHKVGFRITRLAAESMSARRIADALRLAQQPVRERLLGLNGAVESREQSRVGPFTDAATKRHIKTLLVGQSIPKPARQIQSRFLGVQKFYEERLRLAIDATRTKMHRKFKTPASRRLALNQINDYWLGVSPLSAIGDPEVQLAARNFREELDALTLTAINNGMVPDGQVKTWIGHTGEWLRRTYLAFDPDADWNYDTLARRRVREPEIDRIWRKAESFLQTQDPAATDGEIKARMRRLIDREETLSALGSHSERSAGFSVDTGSLIMRQVIPPELLDWMGQIKDPFARARQSSKWLSQFVARNEMQRELARIGLEAGWFSKTEDDRNHIELYPNVTSLKPVLDPLTNKPVKTPSGNVESQYQTKIDRRVEPLHGLFTSPQMVSALQQFNGLLNTGLSATGRMTQLAPTLLIKGVGLWKMGKVALNPISYGVNSLGAIVQRLMAGAVNPIHIFDAISAITTRHRIVDMASSFRAQRSRAAYLLAVKQGTTGKGIFTREIDASFGRESEPKSGPRALRAFADLVQRKGNRGARRRLSRALMDMAKIPGEIGIRLADDVARVSAFFDELSLSYKANPAFTDQEHADWASERAENIYQTYERLPVIWRDLSNLGALSPFVSYTVELFRNAGWIAYYAQAGLRSGNPALMLDGAQKAVGLATMTLLPGAIAALTLSVLDDDEEKAKKKRAAFQRWFIPPWDKGEDLVYRSFDRKKVAYVPMNYLIPSSQLLRIPNEIRKIKNSNNPDLEINQLTEGLVNEFFNSGPWGTAMEALSNTRGSGRKITEATGSRGAKDRLAYAWKNFRPGVIQLADEFWMAHTGEKGFAGRQYSNEEIFSKLAGLRQRTVSPEQAVPFILRDFDRQWRSASATTTLQTRKTPQNTPEIQTAAAYQKQTQDDLKRDFKQFIADAETIGFRKTEIYKIARENKIPVPVSLWPR